MLLWYSLAAINTDMNRKIYGALVQFGCYQHRYKWQGLWCSSTVRLLLNSDCVKPHLYLG